jgi:hypothetical protein
VLSIEGAAERSVARGTGFAALAVGVAMSGLSFMPVLSLKTGAVIALLTWAVLTLKAVRARRRRPTTARRSGSCSGRSRRCRPTGRSG